MNNVLKISIFNSLINLSFMLPIVVLFWLANNLSFTEIMLLQSLFAIAIVILEVPTGYFADTCGRRISLILSAASILLGVLIYSLGHSFYQFLLAETLMAIGYSFKSGADSAFAYDTLKEVYHNLSNWSEIMLTISAIAILGYFIYLFIYLFINKEKRNEKINFKNTGVILLLPFFISLIFYWFSIDTDYDILYCLLPFIP